MCVADQGTYMHVYIQRVAAVTVVCTCPSHTSEAATRAAERSSSVNVARAIAWHSPVATKHTHTYVRFIIGGDHDHGRLSALGCRCILSFAHVRPTAADVGQ